MKNVEIDKNAVPQVIPGLDINSLIFSPEEGFLFSRIDGQTTIDVLVKSSGMTQEQALNIIVSLAEKQAISWDGMHEIINRPKNTRKESPASNPVTLWEDDYHFDTNFLSEDTALDLNTKKKILFLYDNLDELSYYTLLGIDRRADAKDVKRAYFRVSREFHPDSYFRKNLGSYKSKIETIFKRIGTAYDVLSDPHMRKEYDENLPFEPNPEEIARQESDEEQKKKDQRLAQERRARILRRSPIANRKAQAEKHYLSALQEKGKNDTVSATNSIKLALVLDPNNETYRQLLSELAPKAGVIRSEKELRRGKVEESMGRYDEALQAYLLAIEYNPREVEALHRAASLMCSLDRNLRQALSFCRKALMVEPDNIKLRLTLSDIYMALGMQKNALRELSEYVRNNPLDERAAEKLAVLKSTGRDR